MNGICTLGNDEVYDQLVALVNSIEVLAGPTMPICIYPYDNRLTRVKQLVTERPQVQLWVDTACLQRWDDFVEQLWATHPTAQKQWAAIGSTGIHRRGTHRRYCAFDGPFDRFLYMDADTLLLSPPDQIFALLDSFDWVTYDFQHKDPSHVFALGSPRLKSLFSTAQIHHQVFCSGFYGSHRGLLTPDNCQDLLQSLQAGDAEVLYPMAPDQTVLNYLVMRRGLSTCNLAHRLPPAQRTGNAVTSPHFTLQGATVLDKGRPLTYLHYIGVPSRDFRQLCQGKNIAIPYREVFLHYRYRRDPASRPVLREQSRRDKAGGQWRRGLQIIQNILQRGWRK